MPTNTALVHSSPSGLLTLFFTDIESSTTKWERFGDRFAAALQLHDERLRETIESHGGYVVKTFGDSFFAAFTDPHAALRCAINIHRRLETGSSSEPLWREVEGIAVRIGIHTGEPIYRDNDYFGPAVNRASRICDAGHGGLTLVSQETVRHIASQICPDYEIEDFGLFRLKDLGEAERLYLLHPPQQRRRPRGPLRTLDASRHNLPPQVTSFVGRAKETMEIAEMLRRGRSRLITLTGPGGTGKTRLAIHVAADRLHEYPDGVWLVPLDTARQPEEVPSAIAVALSLPPAPTADSERQLTAHLRSRRCLLLLDNFEQVVQAAPFVARLLKECPEVTVLATSREILRVSAEQEYPVTPLSVPPASGTLENLTRFESVRLFVERCQAHKPDFELTDEAAEVVGEICRRLDGIPLALELAAARTRALSPRRLLERLDQKLALLVHERRDLPERQRTLRGAIDWSHDLLTEDERRLFAEASVFRGGFDLEAAEAVCTLPGTMDLLFSLRDKSLITVTESVGNTRYQMLESIREYAAEKLAEMGEADVLRNRHAAAFRIFADRQARAIDRRENVKVALARLTTDLDNIRSGMDLAVSSGDHPAIIEFAKAIFQPLRTQGLYTECDARLLDGERAARASGDRASLARLLNQRGLVAWDRYHLDGALELFEESYALSRELGDRKRTLVTLINLGNIVWGHGDSQGARARWEEALNLAREIGELQYEAVLRMDLGMLAAEIGDRERSRALFERSLAIHQRNGDTEGRAFTLYNRSELFRQSQDFTTALADLRESLALYEQLGHQRGIALAEARIGMTLLEAGDLEAAGENLQKSLARATEMGDRASEMYAISALARKSAADGDLATAEQRFLRAFSIALHERNSRQLADILLYWAESALDHGRICFAFVAASLAEAEFHKRGMPQAERASGTARRAEEAATSEEYEFSRCALQESDPARSLALLGIEPLPL